MTQFAPTSMQYAQLLVLLEGIRNRYLDNEFKDLDEVATAITDVVSKFVAINGGPLLAYELIEHGEPALSEKINRIFRSIENDFNIIQDQYNVLKAAIILTFNTISTELEKAKYQNAAASNKLKTLQLYSSAQDANTIILGDYFKTDELFDKSLISASLSATILSEGLLTLPRENEVKNLAITAKLKVLNTSNGFLGNNQEIKDPSTAVTNPLDNTKLYEFKAQTHRHAALPDVLDQVRTSWLEYEAVRIKAVDKLAAKNLNFVYKYDLTNTATTPIEPSPGVSIGDTIDWANGPRNITAGGEELIDFLNLPGNNTQTNTPLRLDLEMTLKDTATTNRISYTPYGLEDNKNYPVLVERVQVSSDGTDWFVIAPERVWIATDSNLQAARTADNVVIGTAVWTFEQRDVKYIRFRIVQSQPINANIGHVYYETQPQVITRTEEVIDLSTVTGVRFVTTQEIIGGERVQGPVPNLSDPTKDYGKFYSKSQTILVGSNYVTRNLLQKTEYFPGQRWCIGVRDIGVEQVLFKKTGVYVSKSFKINGVVDRVALEADYSVPDGFASDSLWVRFYVSPDDGLSWYPISRVQDDYFGIPEIIAFNDPLPTEFHETGVDYRNVNTTVNSLRLKIELSRPDALKSTSPIVRSYKLKIAKR